MAKKTIFVKKFYSNYESEGLKQIRTNLDKELSKIEGKTIEGLVKAVMLLKKDMQPKTPKDLGNLRRSFFAVTSMGRVAIGDSPKFEGRLASRLSKRHSDMVGKQKGRIHRVKNPWIAFGFSAWYAGYVHEMPASNNWTTPGTGPKYFQEALMRNKDEILNIIANNVRFR